MHKRLRSVFIFSAIVILLFGTRYLMVRLSKDNAKEDLVSDFEEVNEPDIDEELDIDDTSDIEVIYKYTTENLNLRTGPGIDKSIILTLPKGEKVEVISHENGWDKLIYNDTTGYCFSKYLSESNIEIADNNEDELEIIVSPETMKIVKGILLVNKEYALPMGYNPGEDPGAREYLDKMFATCNEEIGKALTAYSGYRTYEYQKNLFNRYVQKDGYDKAVMYSAKPRHSEHETGLAYDIGGMDQTYWLKEAFEDTEEGIWLRENAHRFGFILRYPKGKTDITGYIYEPWHFRYVGIEHATNIYERNITLEEYLLEE